MQIPVYTNDQRVTDLKRFHAVSHDVNSWRCRAERRIRLGRKCHSATAAAAAAAAAAAVAAAVLVDCVEMTMYGIRICCCCCAGLGHLQRHLYQTSNFAECSHYIAVGILVSAIAYTYRNWYVRLNINILFVLNMHNTYRPSFRKFVATRINKLTWPTLACIIGLQKAAIRCGS